MKILTYIDGNQELVGVLSKDENYVISLKSLGFDYKDMNVAIENISDDDIRIINEKVNCATLGIPMEQIKLCAPIIRPKQDVICLGLNFYEHVMESTRSLNESDLKREKAVYFSKRVNETVAPFGFIESHREIVNDLDYEVELAVIIAKDAKDIRADEAQKYIWGYTILNDVSARTLQLEHKQWYFGKSLDGFTPFGPWIVTKDEIDFPPALEIRCFVNGKLRQSGNTSQMIFGIAHVLEELSAGITLKAGTVISMGTPSGVALGAIPDMYLKPGDVVECTIEKIGMLKNYVK